MFNGWVLAVLYIQGSVVNTLAVNTLDINPLTFNPLTFNPLDMNLLTFNPLDMNPLTVIVDYNTRCFFVSMVAWLPSHATAPGTGRER